MYQNHLHTLLKTNLFSLTLILTIGLVGILGLAPMAVPAVIAQTSTSTPTPSPTPEPLKNVRLGMQYWDEALAKDIFLPGTKGQLNGYVLLDNSNFDRGDFDATVSSILNAGLMPIFRIDASSHYAVPIKKENFQDWITDFKKKIERTYSTVRDAYPQEPVLYIVGNEPRLEDGAEGNRFGDGKGGLSAEEYATAYAALWHSVHEEKDQDGNLKYSELNLKLLIAGQAFHQEDTDTWAGTVSQYIVEKSAEVDGYALHTR